MIWSDEMFDQAIIRLKGKSHDILHFGYRIVLFKPVLFMQPLMGHMSMLLSLPKSN